MLRNELYTGTYVWGRSSTQTRLGVPLDPIEVGDAFEPVVFEQVQRLIEERRPDQLPPAIHRGEYQLSTLIVCGHCGSAMIGHPAKGGAHHSDGCQQKMKQGAEACPDA